MTITVLIFSPSLPLSAPRLANSSVHTGDWLMYLTLVDWDLSWAFCIGDCTFAISPKDNIQQCGWGNLNIEWVTFTILEVILKEVLLDRWVLIGRNSSKPCSRSQTQWWQPQPRRLQERPTTLPLRQLFESEKQGHQITTTDLLDNHTYFAQSAFTHLGLWRKLYDCSMHHFAASQCVLKCDRIDIFVELHPIGWNLKLGLFVLGIRDRLGICLFHSLPIIVAVLCTVHLRHIAFMTSILVANRDEIRINYRGVNKLRDVLKWVTTFDLGRFLDQPRRAPCHNTPYFRTE